MYKDRPLLGRVTCIGESSVTIEWLMGSYSGKWSEWKGKVNKETITYTDEIPVQDIVYVNIDHPCTSPYPL